MTASQWIHAPVRHLLVQPKLDKYRIPACEKGLVPKEREGIEQFRL